MNTLSHPHIHTHTHTQAHTQAHTHTHAHNLFVPSSVFLFDTIGCRIVFNNPSSNKFEAALILEMQTHTQWSARQVRSRLLDVEGASGGGNGVSSGQMRWGRISPARAHTMMRHTHTHTHTHTGADEEGMVVSKTERLAEWLLSDRTWSWWRIQWPTNTDEQMSYLCIWEPAGLFTPFFTSKYNRIYQSITNNEKDKLPR